MRMIRTPSAALDTLRAAARPLTGAATDLDPLMEIIGEARFVLLGEATHGTHEFYALRAAITERLITEKGFLGIAVEADWPDAYRVNRYIRARGNDQTPEEALANFQRFPRWMWRNREVVALVKRLREVNDGRAPTERVGFYGIDLYSLHASMAAVVAYLDKVDPAAAARARQRYGCFRPFGDDPQRYGYATTLGIAEHCRDEAVAQLVDLRAKAAEYLSRDGLAAEDEQFFAEQNALVAASAEEYYRAMFQDHAESWNRRDRHMASTLAALARHLSGRGEGSREARVVVWAHNSHIGDARATDAALRAEINLGQLCREQFPGECVLVGFTTHTGTVAAADDWDGPVKRHRVRPSLAGSIESLLHESGVGKALVPMHDRRVVKDLGAPMLHRAIGVVYKPETERESHYFNANLTEEYDAIVHIDTTRAVDPLDRSEAWGVDKEEPAETFPTGL